MRKRNHVVPVRLNAKELRHLDGQVAKSGLNREEFLRSDLRRTAADEALRTSRRTSSKDCGTLQQCRTSLPMLPMAPGWQGKPAYREMLRISKETCVW